MCALDSGSDSETVQKTRIGRTTVTGPSGVETGRLNALYAVGGDKMDGKSTSTKPVPVDTTSGQQKADEGWWEFEQPVQEVVHYHYHQQENEPHEHQTEEGDWWQPENEWYGWQEKEWPEE